MSGRSPNGSPGTTPSSYGTLTVRVVLDEAVLHRIFGDRATLAEQLAHVIRDDMPWHLHVLPQSVAVPPSASDGPVTLLDVDDTTLAYADGWEFASIMTRRARCGRHGHLGRGHGVIALRGRFPDPGRVPDRGVHMIDPQSWRTSTRSASQGACVEVGTGPGVIGIRDSKNRSAGRLVVSRGAFARFVNRLAGRGGRC